MILYGAGGHAKVILDIVQACGDSIKAIFDDNVEKQNFCGHSIHPYSADLFAGESIIVSIGENVTRSRVVKQIRHEFTNAIHPSVLLSADVTFGFGNMIMHRAIIQAGSIISNHVIINTAAVIEHDVVIGNFVHVAPGAIVCGSVHVGDYTLIGAGSIIIPNIKIGKNCVIGAGSVVTADIPDNMTVCGNPARTINHHNTL